MSAPGRSLDDFRKAARRCRDCPLWANATQTVFGAGDRHARVMLVGEQPGDEEDRKGLPFVGPAGRADEGQAFAVLLVAGLLSHEHDPRMPVAGAEYRLRRVRPQRAVPAAPGGFAKIIKRTAGSAHDLPLESFR